MPEYTPIPYIDRIYYVDLERFKGSKADWLDAVNSYQNHDRFAWANACCLPISIPNPDYDDPKIQKTKGLMVRPTVDAIRSYMSDYYARSDNPDLRVGEIETEAQKFHDFYSANGWKVGRNPMKNWEAAARNWIRNGQSKTSRSIGGSCSPNGLQSNPSGASSNDRTRRRDLDSLV